MKTDAHVRIDYIIDGDTVVLKDGKRIRLIGIDTPEIGYKGNASQPGAEDARDFVRGLISPDHLYQLQYGIEQQDHHGRSLAHLFLTDGRNLQALLLAQGYATSLNIPPNLRYSECYQQQVQAAIQAKLGIWNLKQYQPISAKALIGKENGYRIVYGQVTSVTNGASSLWLNLRRQLAIRITHDDLQHFPDIHPETLTGKIIQVRGKLYRHKNQLRLRLRHHSDLKIMSAPDGRN